MDTVWVQCMMRLLKLNELNGFVEITPEEIDRLAVLVTQELTINVAPIIMKITQNPDNKFDDPIPF